MNPDSDILQDQARAGDTYVPAFFTITDANGVAIDITGYTLVQSIRYQLSDPDPGILTTRAGPTNAAAGQISNAFTPAQTIALAGKSLFVSCVVLDGAGNEYTELILQTMFNYRGKSAVG